MPKNKRYAQIEDDYDPILDATGRIIGYRPKPPKDYDPIFDATGDNVIGYSPKSKQKFDLQPLEPEFDLQPYEPEVPAKTEPPPPFMGPRMPEEKPHEKGFFKGVWDPTGGFIEDVLKSTNEAGKAASGHIREGKYPEAFHDIFNPLIGPLEQGIGALVNKVQGQPVLPPMPPPGSPEARQNALEQALGVAGIPTERFREAYEDKDYPRMVGQGLGAATMLYLGKKGHDIYTGYKGTRPVTSPSFSPEGVPIPPAPGQAPVVTPPFGAAPVSPQFVQSVPQTGGGEAKVAGPAPTGNRTVITLGNPDPTVISMLEGKGFVQEQLPGGKIQMVKGGAPSAPAPQAPVADPNVQEVPFTVDTIGAITEDMRSKGWKLQDLTTEGKAIFKRFVGEDKGSSDWHDWFINWAINKIRRRGGQGTPEEVQQFRDTVGPHPAENEPIPVIPSLEEAKMMDSGTANSFIDETIKAADYWQKRLEEFIDADDIEGIKIALDNKQHSDAVLQELGGKSDIERSDAALQREIDQPFIDPNGPEQYSRDLDEWDIGEGTPGRRPTEEEWNRPGTTDPFGPKPDDGIRWDSNTNDMYDPKRWDVFDPKDGIPIATFATEAEADAFLRNHPNRQNLDIEEHGKGYITPRDPFGPKPDIPPQDKWDVDQQPSQLPPGHTDIGDTRFIDLNQAITPSRQVYEAADELSNILKQDPSQPIHGLIDEINDIIIRETDPVIAADNVRQLYEYLYDPRANDDHGEIFQGLYDDARDRLNQLNGETGIVPDPNGTIQQTQRPLGPNAAFNARMGRQRLSDDLWRLLTGQYPGERRTAAVNDLIDGTTDLDTIDSHISALDEWIQEMAHDKNFDEGHEMSDFRGRALQRRREIIREVTGPGPDTAHDIGGIRMQSVLSAPEGGGPSGRINEALEQPALPLGPHTELIPRELPMDKWAYDPMKSNEIPRAEGPPVQGELDFNPKVWSDILKKFIVDESGTFDPEEIWNNFKEVLPVAISWKGTRFLLPDGTRLSHQGDIHADAANKVGYDLSEAMEAGIIRIADGADGAEISTPITHQQAEVLRDTIDYTGRVMRVDVNVDKSGGIPTFKKFGEDHTADSIYNWVNRFFREEKGSLQLPSKQQIKQGWKATKDFVKGPLADFGKEALAVPAAATTTGDFSPLGRQGLLMINTPEFWKAILPAFRSISHNQWKQIDASIRQMKNFKDLVDPRTGKRVPDLAEQLGVKLFTPASEPGAHAEAVASRWLETGGNIPIASKVWRHTLGYPIRATNRFYVTFLNHLKANRFNFLMDRAKDISMQALNDPQGRAPRQGMLGGFHAPDWMGGFDVGLKRKYSPQEALEVNPYTNMELGKQIANFINAASGQANPTNTLERAVSAMGPVLFSPGLLNSRIRFLNPLTYVMGSPFVRKQYTKAAIGGVLGYAAFMTMAKKAAQAQGLDYEIVDDITNADYGKFRIGNTRFDAGGSFLQFAVLLGRMYKGGWTSSSNPEAGFHKFGQGFQPETQLSNLGRFGANKLSPIYKFAYDVADASENKPVQMGDRTLQMFVNLFSQDLLELYSENPELLPWAIPVGFGWGTQTYEKYGDPLDQTKGRLWPWLTDAPDWEVQGGGLRDLLDMGEEEDPNQLRF